MSTEVKTSKGFGLEKSLTEMTNHYERCAVVYENRLSENKDDIEAQISLNAVIDVHNLIAALQPANAKILLAI